MFSALSKGVYFYYFIIPLFLFLWFWYVNNYNLLPWTFVLRENGRKKLTPKLTIGIFFLHVMLNPFIFKITPIFDDISHSHYIILIHFLNQEFILGMDGGLSLFYNVCSQGWTASHLNSRSDLNCWALKASRDFIQTCGFRSRVSQSIGWLRLSTDLMCTFFIRFRRLTRWNKPSEKPRQKPLASSWPILNSHVASLAAWYWL